MTKTTDMEDRIEMLNKENLALRQNNEQLTTRMSDLQTTVTAQAKNIASLNIKLGNIDFKALYAGKKVLERKKK